jgi:hypothetical protein
MNPKQKPYVPPAPGGQSSQERVAGPPIFRTVLSGPVNEVVPVPVDVWQVSAAGPTLTPEEATDLRRKLD